MPAKKPVKKHKSLFKNNLTKGLVAVLAVGLAFVGVMAVQAASAVVYTDVPFTSTELSANWSTDRTTPSGGYSSVTFGGRTNVLQMGIVGANRSTSDPFYYTEGLQRKLSDSTTGIQADLYLDNTWLAANASKVRAGLWGVGKDASGGITAYPIIEFTTAGGNNGDYTGWRVWDGVAGGWTSLDGLPYLSGAWNKLSVVFNSETNQFDISVNDTVSVHSSAGSTVKIGAVILNSYNYGVVAGVSQNYQVRWSNFSYVRVLVSPESADDCKDNGWSNLGFRNQGLCIQYANTAKDSR